MELVRQICTHLSFKLDVIFSFLKFIFVLTERPNVIYQDGQQISKTTWRWLYFRLYCSGDEWTCGVIQSEKSAPSRNRSFCVLWKMELSTLVYSWQVELLLHIPLDQNQISFVGR